MGAENLLPEVVVNKPNQVIEVRKTSNNDLIRIFRMKGNSAQVKLMHPGTFTIKIGDKEIGSFETKQAENKESIKVEI
jgi:alkaline phosphatase D